MILFLDLLFKKIIMYNFQKQDTKNKSILNFLAIIFLIKFTGSHS